MKTTEIKLTKNETEIVTISIDALKEEMRLAEREIKAAKLELKKPHTLESSSIQGKLATNLKPWANFLCVLRTYTKGGKIHTSMLKPTSVDDKRTPIQRLNDTINYWLTPRYGYKPSFLVKLA